MANFKRKETTKRKKARREDPCNNWITPKSIQRATTEKKYFSSFSSFITKHGDILLPVLERLSKK